MEDKRWVIIWDEVNEEPIKFFVATGNLGKFDRVYCNSYKPDNRPELSEDDWDSLTTELSNLIAELNSLDKFPLDEVKNGANVLVAGFLP